MISREAEEALKQYYQEPTSNIHPNNWFERLEHDYTSAETCFKQIVTCAKKDLKV